MKNSLSYNCPDTFNDKWLIERVFKNKFDGFFIEAGGGDGISESPSYLLEQNFNWKGIILEPTKIGFSKISNIRQSKCFNKVLYNNNSNVEFLTADNFFYSGIVEDIVQGHKDECYKQGYKIEKIESVSLDFLLKEQNVPHHINFICLDTEGSEYKILKDFCFSSYEIDLFIIEMSNGMCKYVMKDNGFIEVKNEFNTKSPWECYFASPKLIKDSNLIILE